MKLRNKILSFALPLTLIPFLLTAVAVYYYFIRANRIRIEEEDKKILAETVVHLRRELQGARKDLALLAEVSAIHDYLGAAALEDSHQKEASAHSVLKLFFEQNPYYMQLSLVDAQGRERIKLSKLPGGQDLDLIAAEDFFIRTLITGRVQAPVTELQPDRFATFLTHQVRGRDFLGAVVLHLNADVFQRSLRQLLADHGVSTFLFDDRGLIFGSSFVGAQEESIGRGIDLTAEAAGLLAKPAREISRKDISTGKGDYVFSVHLAETYERFRLEPRAGENWFLGVLRRQEDLAGQTGSFPVIFLGILVSAGGAVLWVATRYSRRVTGPLEQVSAATSEIAGGRFDVKLDITTGDEVEDLASAVKQMAGDLRDYQAKLVRSAKLATIGEMASEISHEIQNRISGLSLWIQHLDSETGPNDPRSEYLVELKQGLGGFTDLLRDLKQLYRTPVLEYSDIDLNALVRETLLYVEDRARERQIQVELQLEPVLPNVRGDAEKIRSVLLNLLINGIDSIQNKGRIVVCTCSSQLGDQKSNLNGDAVKLSVKDSGCGIAEEDLPRVFYPFYSTKAGGGGLGLAISSNLIAAHGGKIEVDSRVGEGTKFTVILPCGD